MKTFKEIFIEAKVMSFAKFESIVGKMGLSVPQMMAMEIRSIGGIASAHQMANLLQRLGLDLVKSDNLSKKYF